MVIASQGISFRLFLAFGLVLLARLAVLGNNRSSVCVMPPRWVCCLGWQFFGGTTQAVVFLVGAAFV